MTPYTPKTSLKDINDYGHFLNRGAWMTASGYGRKFLTDLAHAEACLAEREAALAECYRQSGATAIPDPSGCHQDCPWIAAKNNATQYLQEIGYDQM